MKIIIAGSRGFNDYELLKAKVDATISKLKCEIIIVSGNAKGADQLGERYAKERGFKLEIYPAQWEQFGNKAGPIRNTQMAKIADALIAFWDCQSTGTRHMISKAEERGLQVRVIKIRKE